MIRFVWLSDDYLEGWPEVCRESSYRARAVMQTTDDVAWRDKVAKVTLSFLVSTAVLN